MTKEEARWKLDPEPAGETSSEPASMLSFDEDGALRRYLGILLGKLNCLEFGDPAELIQAWYGVRVPPSKLQDIWVIPQVREVPIGLLASGSQLSGVLEIPFSRGLQKPGRAHVLLGRPGGGKSTVCRFHACQLADEFKIDGDSRVPLYVTAQSVRLGASPEDAMIEAALDGTWPSTEDRSNIQSALRRLMGRSFVLLDGLDEVAIKCVAGDLEVTRARLTELVRNLLATYPGSRCLLTCRETDYAADPAAVLSEAVHLGVSVLSPEQVRRAVRRWHDGAKSAMSKIQAPVAPAVDWDRRCAEVTEFVRADADLGLLAQVPLLLNMLQVVYTSGAAAPRSIGALADRAVRFLAYEKPKLRSVSSPSGAARDVLHEWLSGQEAEHVVMGILQELAYLNQTQLVDGTNDGVTKGVSFEEIQQIASRVAGVRASDYAQTGKVAFHATVHVLRGNGVLVSNESGKWTFTHNVFREVLAGQTLQRVRMKERVALACNDAWHLPLRYWAGFAAASESGIGIIFMMAKELASHAEKHVSDRVNCVLACAEIMCEVRSVSEVVGPTAVLDELVEAVRRDLMSLLEDRRLRLQQRVRAGDLLGSLGDPRIGSSVADMAFVNLPAGQYTVGRKQPHNVLNTAKYADCQAAPAITGDHGGHRIGLFPVTNRDYRLFIEAGGYKESSNWCSEEASLWFRQDARFLRDLEALVDGSKLKHFMTEVSAGRVSADDLAALRDRILKRDVPLCWYDPRFNRPNEPVVGVNWWEAMAFGRWAEACLRKAGTIRPTARVSLPTEIDWECSAKGQAQISPFPWGTDSPAENAHVRSAPAVARTCGVGLFPWARYPGGPLDMVGNVWEWTVSVPGPLRVELFSRRPDNVGTSDRVVRGGSWLSSEPEATHATFRSFDPPCNAYEDLGFRLAIFEKAP